MDYGGPRDDVDQEENFDDLIDFNGGVDDWNEGIQGEGTQGEGNGDFEFGIDEFNRMTDPINEQTINSYPFSQIINQFGGNSHFELHPPNHNSPGPVSNQAGNNYRIEQYTAAQHRGVSDRGGHYQNTPRALGQASVAETGLHGRARTQMGKKGAVPKFETDRGKKNQTAPQKSRSSPPAYVADINDPDHARWTLSHPRPSDFTPLRLRNDDLAAVKSRMHFYAKQLHDALQDAGVVDLSDYPNMSRTMGPDRDHEIANRFQKQQREALEKVKDLMMEPQQIKNARANCVLAYDAAVFVHETGVPTKDFEGVTEHPERKSAHYPHIDLMSICSARLEKMIALVRDFKPIALDMLEGKHMRDFAQDPMYYAGKKQTFLKSNATRAASNAAAKKGNDVVGGSGTATGSEVKSGGESPTGRQTKRRKMTAAGTEALLGKE
ncbi:hypothetical protein LTR91_006011 [Friedmanniomyces endolithicus]|uniref:Uncharacterized protein n=1 Tax=Friedmanniomyces endolithicus TaxID=329885 RepID=A0A4U0UJF9_9PEZI|nr:hypothetical protein LTS09_006163 [Friedmanniomyces endolithicus]KAK0277384.1 hypothetical protein LTR35_009785 [Friedmanniomyces endolithicus]KAK0283115.1 hypothetical protein LTS00_011718 [Friedmanniomyces endolithicus]KAK0311137.1 hypothetical protein LTR01_003130 [Friedmanniomyces endolithicus]KAK0320133.1 hypothetical protein LTR82_009070 [Friedmanniomyces endolithicus]